MFWEAKDITDGEQVVDAVEAKTSVNPGSPDEVFVFPSAAGGQPASFPASGGAKDWPRPFKTTAATFDTAAGSVSSPQFGSLTIGIPANHKHFEAFEDTITLTRIPGAQYAGVLDRNLVKAKVKQLKHKQASPVEIDDLDIDPVK